jgi:hypothetical protein
MAENQPGKFLGFMSLVGLGLAFWNVIPHLETYNPSDFFQPGAVASIANSLPMEEDKFVIAAWEWVAQQIPYEPIGSQMNFTHGQIECMDCFLPLQSLERDEGNCVAKSALLASILANRIALNRIHIMVGKYTGGGGITNKGGGHAWVELYREGNYYLLESTAMPNEFYPWVLADSTYPLYEPMVLITSSFVECEDPAVCAGTAKCSCESPFDKRYLRR